MLQPRNQDHGDIIMATSTASGPPPIIHSQSQTPTGPTPQSHLSTIAHPTPMPLSTISENNTLTTPTATGPVIFNHNHNTPYSPPVVSMVTVPSNKNLSDSLSQSHQPVQQGRVHRFDPTKFLISASSPPCLPPSTNKSLSVEPQSTIRPVASPRSKAEIEIEEKEPPRAQSAIPRGMETAVHREPLSLPGPPTAEPQRSVNLAPPRLIQERFQRGKIKYQHLCPAANHDTLSKFQSPQGFHGLRPPVPYFGTAVEEIEKLGREQRSSHIPALTLPRDLILLEKDRITQSASITDWQKYQRFNNYNYFSMEEEIYGDINPRQLTPTDNDVFILRILATKLQPARAYEDKSSVPPQYIYTFGAATIYASLINRNYVDGDQTDPFLLQ